MGGDGNYALTGQGDGCDKKALGYGARILSEFRHIITATQHETNVMSDAKNKKSSARSIKIAAARAEREMRLIDALRANLKRRKGVATTPDEKGSGEET